MTKILSSKSCYLSSKVSEIIATESYRSWVTAGFVKKCCMYPFRSGFISCQLLYPSLGICLYHLFPLDAICIQQGCNGAFTLQVAGPKRWSGLVKQLKYPLVDDKWSSFITSNKAYRFRHPIQPNVGKHQRKAGRLRSLKGLHMHFDYDYQY